ncbi:hypothetical protein ACKFKF_32650 [Phormidesmis sp. 146-12]
MKITRSLKQRIAVPRLVQPLFGKVVADKGDVWQNLAKQCHPPKKPSIVLDHNLLLSA